MRSEHPLYQATIDHFLAICRIPHGSKRCAPLMEHLLRFAEERGLAHGRDDYGNVYMDLPASPGCEAFPKAILQAHYDMVCVAEPGYEIDFETEPLQVVVEADCIRALHTSLGADDCIGVATMLALADSDLPHGPLRLIFTADEELGLLGANAMPADFLDADLLFNLDRHAVGEIVYANAGGLRTILSRGHGCAAPAADELCFSLAVSGLLGGHSGENMGKGRLNAALALDALLLALFDAGLSPRLCCFHAGSASNSIPAEGELCFLLPKAAREQAEKLLQTGMDALRKAYPAEDPAFSLQTESSAAECRALSAEDSLNFLRLLQEHPYELLARDPEDPRVILSSCNIGVVTLEDGKARVDNSFRFRLPADKEAMDERFAALAKRFGFSYEVFSCYPAWQGKKNTPLLALLQKAHQECIGKEAKLIVSNGGLECSFFAEKRPGLQMACLGPDYTGNHSFEEKLYTASLSPHLAILCWTLAHLGELGE